MGPQINLTFRLTSCKVSSDDNEVYVIHTMTLPFNDVCFDNSRKRFRNYLAN